MRTSTPSEPRNAASDGVDVGQLQTGLHSGLIDAIHIPERRAAVTGIAVYESAAQWGGLSQLALMIGAPVSMAATLVGEAADRGCAAVVLERIDSLSVMGDVNRVAAQRRIAVFQRHRDASWLTIADAVRELVRRADTDQEAAAGVPIGDLSALAEALATMLGGPVIIEDSKFSVLAYSSSTGRIDRGRDVAILGRRIPDEWLKHLEAIGATERLLSSDAVIDVRNGPFQARRRVLCAIRADGFTLGILWLAEGSEPLAEDIALRMAAAARIATPHLLRHQEENFGYRSAQLKILRGLLTSGQVSRSAAEELRIAPATGYVIVALRCLGDATMDQVDRNRAIDSIALYCQSYRWREATTAIGHTIYCLIALTGEQNDASVDRLADGLSRSARHALQNREILVAISDVGARLSDVADLREQTDRVLDVYDRGNRTRSAIVRYAEEIPDVLLRTLSDTVDASGIRFHKLDLLREHDATTGSDYIPTVRAYLQAFGNTQVAADHLGLHATTLRYRLKRISAISGLDLNAPAQRLLCELLLRDES